MIFGMMAFNKVNEILDNGGAGLEEIIASGFEIKIYDSNPSNREAVYLPNEYAYYKVSDKLFTKEELIGAKLASLNGDFIITESDIRDGSALGVTTSFLGIVTLNSMLSYAVSCKACTLTLDGGVEVTFPSDGTYFIGGYSGSYENPCPAILLVQELSKAGETKIHPINPKFLPGQSVLDLGEFVMEDGNSFSTALYLMVADSLDGGGVVKTQTVIDVGGKLKAAANKQKNAKICMTNGLYVTDFPAAYAYDESGVVQISGVSFVCVGDMVFESALNIGFSKTNNEVYLLVRAKPIEVS